MMPVILSYQTGCSQHDGEIGDILHGATTLAQLSKKRAIPNPGDGKESTEWIIINSARHGGLSSN